MRVRRPLPRATIALVALLVAARVALDAAGVSEDGGLVGAGARDTGRILAGEPWRLLTSTLLHGNWAHLAFNGAALGALGYLLEASLGPARFLLFFLLAAVAGNLVSLGFAPQEISVGSSGGVYGLGGVLAALLARGVPPFGDRRRSRIALLLLVPGLLVGVLNGFLRPDIDGFAHLGGLAAGLALGAATRTEPVRVISAGAPS